MIARNLIAAVALTSVAFAAGAAGFSVRSPTVKPGTKLTDLHVYKGFGCDGKNESPALNWSGAPAGTKSYAVTVYDPDAPTGSGWWHWVVYNIPASVTSLAAGAGAEGGKALPAGAQMGRTDFGTAAFGGACPPPGSAPHRYIFAVHALKVEKIEVPADASAALVGFNLSANRIGEAKIWATYNR